MTSIEPLIQKTGNGLQDVKMVEVSHHSFTDINNFLLTKHRSQLSIEAIFFLFSVLS